MKPKIYVETSVISYLTGRMSRDLIVAGHQQITQEWWETRKPGFELYGSQLLIKEAGAGDKEASQKRLAVLADIPLLELNREVGNFGGLLISGNVLPPKAVEDAIHIAVATVHSMDYLLTWNCNHIAN
ncbi:MAG: type II toxin-antitoxin system VapC family toxin, partial [Gammaproteobacteria bacterium]|nr:type II toxin-antitoxin system VapC family toxin [Gammaproteobacteria bacterium]